jgi:hypothetical protein
MTSFKILAALLIFCCFNVSAAIQVRIAPNAEQVCAGDSLILKAEVLSGTPLQFKWTSTIAQFDHEDSANCKALFSSSGNVVLRATDGIDTVFDTLFVQYNFLPSVILMDKDFCQSQDSIFLAKERVVVKPANLGLGSQEWTCLNCADKGIRTDLFKNIKSNPLEEYVMLISEDYLQGIGDEITLKVALEFTNASGCSNTDSSEITIHGPPKITSLDLATVCGAATKKRLNDLYRLAQKQTTWSISDPKTLKDLEQALSQDSLDLSFLPKAHPDSNYYAYKFQVNYTDSFGCKSQKAVSLDIKSTVKVEIDRSIFPNELDGIYPFCESDSFTFKALEPYSNGKWFVQKSQEINSGVFIPYFWPKGENLPIYYYYSDEYQCLGSDSLTIYIDHQPSVSILTSDTSICAKTTTIEVEAKLEWSDGLVWWPLSGGKVSDTKSLKTNFTETRQGDTSETKLLLAQTESHPLCGYSSKLFTLTLCVGTGNISSSELKPFSLFHPNPSNGVLQIPVQDEIQFTIYNSKGQIVPIRPTSMGYFELTTGIYFAIIQKPTKGRFETYYQRLVVIR